MEAVTHTRSVPARSARRQSVSPAASALPEPPEVPASRGNPLTPREDAWEDRDT
jgi:hypothetical protein